MKIFDKLNLKNQKEILVLNAPKTFEAEIAALDGVAVTRRFQDLKEIDFVLAFVMTQKEVDGLAQLIVDKTAGDAVIWFAYPKGTSKHFKSEINRDSGWQLLLKGGFDTVRMVAVDEDWSALRFRRTEYIKTISRDKKPS